MGNALGTPNVPRGTQIQVAVVGSKGVGTDRKTEFMTHVQKKLYPKKDVRWLEANKAHWSFSMELNEFVSLRLTEEPDADQPTTFVFETADVCILCFSVVDERTYQAVLDKWIPAASQNPDLPIVLVGTQVDLRPDGKKKPKAAAAPHKVHEELKKASEHPKHCLAQMPGDVLQQIFSHLPLADLYSAMRVSKRWNKVANGRYIWKNRVRRRGKPITTALGRSMAEKISAEKYLECSAVTGQGMRAVVDEVLKQGIQALHDNSTLGGGGRRKRKDAEKKKAEEKDKGKERDDNKKTNGTASSADAKSSADASAKAGDKAKGAADPSARPPSATNGATPSSATDATKEKDKSTTEAAKPAAASTSASK